MVGVLVGFVDNFTEKVSAHIVFASAGSVHLFASAGIILLHSVFSDSALGEDTSTLKDGKQMMK